jgi:hypothetical protein
MCNYVGLAYFNVNINNYIPSNYIRNYILIPSLYIMNDICSLCIDYDIPNLSIY